VDGQAVATIGRTLENSILACYSEGMERVCFIRPKGEPGPILVVSGSSPTQLLSVAQFGNPTPLSIMGSVDAASYPEEWWHETLSPWRLRGAWYEPKAQVLCRVEDALRGALEAPVSPPAVQDTLDPLLDSEGAGEPAERVSEVYQHRTPEEIAAERWAWPEVDPYPKVTPDRFRPSEAAPVLKKLLQAAA